MLPLLFSCTIANSSTSVISSSSEEENSSNETSLSSSEEESSSSDSSSVSSEEESASSSSSSEEASSDDTSSSSEESSSSSGSSESSSSSDESSDEESSSEGTSSSDDSYYAGISSTLTKSYLKTALFNLIKNHESFSYDYAYTIYKSSDCDEDGKIIDVYSSYHFDPDKDRAGNYSKEGDCFNREHTIPQSIFSKGSPMKSDVHHLLPTDGYVNNRRSNYPHAEVGNAIYTSTNGTKVGSSSTSGFSGNACEPIDEYKGDFARIYFYMVTRYQDKLSSWKSYASFSGDSYPSLSSWAIDLYLKWHEQDPVSEKEIKRNEAIYSYQQNRNPFIDHPEYAERIWGQ